ncbi:MAG: glycosyltransferase, partial [Nitrospira sp.]|nr:glycosyltransferase [Nitrospira sp.]
ENVKLVYIGRGERLKPTQALVADEGYGNIHFHDYRPMSELPDSLGACDVAVVCLEAGADGLAMPSKLPGIFAAGRPVLVLAPTDSEIAQLVTGEDVGVAVDPRDGAEVVKSAILRLRSDPERLKEMGLKSRKLAEGRSSVETAVAAYSALLDQATA